MADTAKDHRERNPSVWRLRQHFSGIRCYLDCLLLQSLRRPVVSSAPNPRRQRSLLCGATSIFGVEASERGLRIGIFPKCHGPFNGAGSSDGKRMGLALCIVRKQAGTLSFFVVALVMFVLSQIMLKNLIPQARYFLTICSLLLLFVGPGCADLSRRLEPRFDKRSVTYFIATVAVAWPLFIALVASFNVGWLSQKMYSLSPHPRFEKSIVDVNIWLRNNGADAGSLAFFLGGNNFAGPWSSLLDQWYGTQTLKRHELIQPHSRQIHFLREPFELITIVKEEPCGHLVVSTKFAEHRLSSDLHLMLQQQPVYVSPEFKIFAWGETCFGRPGGKR